MCLHLSYPFLAGMVQTWVLHLIMCSLVLVWPISLLSVCHMVNLASSILELFLSSILSQRQMVSLGMGFSSAWLVILPVFYVGYGKMSERAPEARVAKGVWGHSPPEIFEI